MARIFLLFFMIGLIGCASTAVRQKTLQSGAGSKNEYIGEMQGSNVYAAIKSLLKKGTTVNVMVDYQSAYDGLAEGYLPVDFGCEVDSETIIETEKIFLLDSFSKYPNFSVIDRTQMNTSFAEMKLGMSEVTSSNVRPGDFSGASHLIVIEGRDHFFRLKGKNKDRYTELKKFLDIQKSVVMAMDRFSEERDVENSGRRRAETKSAAQPQETPPVPENAGLQQLPPRIEVTPAPPPEKVETITIYGNHMQPDSEQPRQTRQMQEERNETVVTVPAVSVQEFSSARPYRMVRRIPDWQFARIVKQRFPNMKNKDNETVVHHFIQTHPEYRDRIITTKRKTISGN